MTLEDSSAVLSRSGVCWRRARAEQVAPLIDGAAYFAALAQALEGARHSVFLLGWDLNADLVLDPATGPETLVARLSRLTERRPELTVRLLVWDWIFFYSLDRQMLPQWRFENGGQVRFQLDGHHPAGGCLHEKLVVIDGSLAFVGGIDLTAGRWDTPAHPAREPRRAVTANEDRPPFHDLMLMVQGPVALDLEELARERWRVATGEAVPPTESGPDAGAPWPSGLEPWLSDVAVGIARTRPDSIDWKPAREIERLYLEAVGAAEDTIYIENQYLTAETVANRIAARMAERPALETVIVTPAKCEGLLETAVMDVGRARFTRRVRRAARKRVRIVYPEISDGDDRPVPINVHAKLLIVDDRLLCVGSANLANRSFGLDTEICLAIEAAPDDDTVRAFIRRLRDTLLAEHLETSPEAVQSAVAAAGGRVIPVLDQLGGRLRPLRLRLPTWLRLVAAPARLADLDEPLTPARVAEHLGTPRQRRAWQANLLQVGALLALMVGFGILAHSDLLGVHEHIEAVFALADRHAASPLGALIVVATFVLCSLVLVPVTLLIAATAATLGPLAGFSYALLGSVAAAGVTFLIGRLLGRERVRRLAGRRVAAVNRRLGQHGIIAVALLRLVPLAPFTVVNIVAGVSEVRLFDFMIGSGIGLAPGIAVTTLFGSQLGAWLRAPDTLGLVILLGSLALLLAAGFTLRRWGRSRTPA